MADITHELMIRYGLSRRPTVAEADRWTETTRSLIRQGVSGNDAGHRAATQILPGVGTVVYASESDTIEMLLRKADK